MQRPNDSVQIRFAILLFGIIFALGPATPAIAQERNAAADLQTEFQHSLTDLPDLRSLNVHRAVYVPVYARIRGTGKMLLDVATTLRVDNTSSSKTLVIDRIDYFDTAGKLVQAFLNAPIALRPFGAITISIPADDRRGGSAANFLVTWSGNGPIAEPVIEAVMVGTHENSSYSFVSQGRTIKTIGRGRWF